jgi:membrane fusion protein, multidrug efflux system
MVILLPILRALLELKMSKNSPLFKYNGLNFVIISICSIVLFSCDRNKDSTKAPAPVVTVAEVVQETIPIYLNYVGNTQSVRSVDIGARVEGFLIERAFEDGSDVKEGDLLFVIDPREFQAQLDNAIAQLAKDDAALKYAREQVKRYKPLVDKDFITRDQFDQYVTDVEEAKAAVEADRAAVRLAELNLSYCRMYAPFDGRIGQRQVDVGNVVGVEAGFGEITKLATLVQLDPIYVYFSPSERDLPEILRKREDGELKVSIVLPDESVHPHGGVVDFVNNTVDLSTSTILMRAIVPNPEKKLLPGQFAHVRLRLKVQPNALLVPEQAVGEAQGGSYVYVVSDENKVEDRSVELGTTYNGKREITKGVILGERVIIDGLQKVRPGITVTPKLASTNSASKDSKSSPQPAKGND